MSPSSARRSIHFAASSFAAAALITGAGCASGPAPDLKRLYEVSSSKQAQDPVILIPGILGSKLRIKETGEEIWPGGIGKLLFSNYENLAFRIDPETLEPIWEECLATELFDRIAGRDFYGKIIETLEEAGGYIRGGQGLSSLRKYYVFTYDWRLDLVDVAVQLDHFIEGIREEFDQPDLKVDILAHSMGALLTRYYLRYGPEDVLASDHFRPTHAGADKVNKVILIGAPNLGSISGLQTFMKGYSIGGPGGNMVSPRILLTMPSMYQILPHPDRDWMVSIDGEKINRDLYDLDTWQIYRWLVFDPEFQQEVIDHSESRDEGLANLAVLTRYFEMRMERARRFHQALSTPVPDSPVRYIVFGGVCTLTPARCLIEEFDGIAHVRLRPSEIVNPRKDMDYERLMLEPGDGQVTKPSLLARNTLDPTIASTSKDIFPLAYSLFICEDHEHLTGNLTLKDNMLDILLTQETTEDRLSR